MRSVEHVEGCLAATFRACNAITRLAGSLDEASSFTQDHSSLIKKVTTVRNQFEHAHTQIVSGETGDGPILMAFDDMGASIRFRSVKLATLSIHTILVGAYRVVASMFPQFDSGSAPEVARPIVLPMTMNMTMTEQAVKQGD